MVLLRSVAWSRLLAGFVTVSVGLALVVVAVRADGSEASTIRLDDGAVWVLNEQAGRVGRLNIRIDELDLEVAAGPGALSQEDRDVVFSSSDGLLRKVDVVTAQVPPTGELPAEFHRLGGGIGVAYDPGTGSLWTGPSAAVVGNEYPEEPDAQIRAGSLVHVTRGSEPDGTGRGRVIVVDELGWYELALDEQLAPVRADASSSDDGADASQQASTSTPADGGRESADDEGPPPVPRPTYNPLPVPLAEITAVSSVGHVPLMSLSDGRVAIGGAEPVDIPGEITVLQQAGPVADSALVASENGLFEIALDGVEAGRVFGNRSDGTPAQPVRVAGCVYAAWSNEVPSLSKKCGESVLHDGTALPDAAAGGRLVFRVNGPNVALNQPADGGVWVDRDGELSKVGEWNQAEPQLDESDEEPSDGEGPLTAERVCRDGGDALPTAGDDELGARPRQTVLDVLANDDDANCEPIAVVSVSPDSGPWGGLTIINDGQHVLYSPSTDWAGDAQESAQVFRFSYTVADGAGNESVSASASVSVRARTLLDRPPALRPRSDGSTREMRTVVEEGRAIEHDVLADWWDPDGDELQVIDAVGEGAGQVSVAGDTTVRFEANGVSPGREVVQVTVSDGVKSAVEPLEVTVQTTGSRLAPVTADDFLTIAEGSTGTVFPLANDSDPNEDRLSLRPLWEAAAGDAPAPSPGYRARVVRDGGVEIDGLVAGSYALRYEASDGDTESPGTVLLRVLDPSGDSAPVAVPDTVHVRAGRIANVDVLANDVDADGDLLAVSEVSVGSSGADGEVMRASVVDRRLVQIEVLATGDGSVPAPMLVSYTVSDGRERERAVELDAEESAVASLRSQGTLRVIVEPSSRDQSPIAVPDAATVRVGDVVSVPVLRNDVDPDGDEMSLLSIDDDAAARIEADGAGVVWVDGNDVVFKAGAAASGRYSVVYTMAAGDVTQSSEVAFNVTDAFSEELGNNQPPEPPDLELRAVRDGRVRLKIPTSNVDRDGDSVSLVRLLDHDGAAAGNQVSIDAEHPDTVVFEATPSSRARDRFVYEVEDVFGEAGLATVDVVVIDDSGAPPVAHDDSLRGRPGRTISVSTLTNDTSPQDRQLSLAQLPFFDVDGIATDTPVNSGAVTVADQSDPADHGRVDVVVPSLVDTTVSEVYRISDGFGEASATLRVTSDPETPNLPPIARTDDVPLDDVLGTTETSVDVLANDADPDDVGAAFRGLEVIDGQRARLDAATSEVIVEIEELPRTVVYRITDRDSGVGVGQIKVPGYENHPPVLSEAGEMPETRVVQAGSDEAIQLELADIVTDPDGDTDIRLIDTELRTVSGIGEVRRRGDDVSGFEYVPPSDLSAETVVFIEFEVSDRHEPDWSPDAQRSTACKCIAALTVGVTVLPPPPEPDEPDDRDEPDEDEEDEPDRGSPPRVRVPGSVQVPQLDEPVTIDLARLVIDDDGDPLTFALESPERLEARLNGSVLEVVSRLSGDEMLPIGTRLPIRYTVSDGEFDPVEGTVTATIIATNKPRPSAATFPVFEAERDEVLELPNLVEAAQNPFPDKPLVLASAVSDGDSMVDCDEQGTCTFTTSSVGTFTVAYTLRDDLGRTAVGELSVVAKGRPLAPGVPRIESVGDGHVNITWDAADPQGSDISSYTVRVEADDGTTTERSFETTGGRVDGLTNAVGHVFSVSATNELGEGDESGQSSLGIPDRIPSPPINLRFEDYGDGTLSMAWDPPTDSAEYSAITDYEVTVNATPVRTGGATTFEAAGLANGTDYDFQVRARNDAETDGGWGAQATSTQLERPSRQPDPPVGVTAVNSGDGGTPRLTVTWSAPEFDGGRGIEDYQVCEVTGILGTCQLTGGPTTQATFEAARNLALSFEVVAFNSDKNRNDSDPSAASTATTTVGVPDTPVLAAGGTSDKQVTVNVARADNGSGCSQQFIEYSVNDGGWQAGPSNGLTIDAGFSNDVVNGVSNGQDYEIRARAVLGPTCGTPGETYVSAPSNVVSQRPYGDLQTPSVELDLTRTDGQFVQFNWNDRRRDDERPTWQRSLSSGCFAGLNWGETFNSDGTSTSGTIWRKLGWYSSTTCVITVSADDVPSASATVVAETLGPDTWIVEVILVSTSTTPSDCREGSGMGGNDISLRDWTYDGSSIAFLEPRTSVEQYPYVPRITGEIWDNDPGNDDKIADFNFRYDTNADQLETVTLDREYVLSAQTNHSNCISTVRLRVTTDAP